MSLKDYMDTRTVSERLHCARMHRSLGRIACSALAIFSFSSTFAAGNYGEESAATESMGPVRLTSPRASEPGALRSEAFTLREPQRPKAAYRPGEFEIYVNRLQGLDLPEGGQAGSIQPPEGWIRRLGSEAVLDEPSPSEIGRQASPDYVLGSGDEVQLTLWGSVDGDLRLTVDRAGRITIPRVGPVLVAGVRYGDLNDVIRSRVGQVFKNFQVSAALGKLRSIRIYVTGFTAQPGAYTVSSLSTIASAVNRAGGPSAAGSFRNIELRRNGKVVSRFDYYDLLLKGDQSTDRVLQAEDVVHIGPVGAQVAILGSVNKPSILELKTGETADDVIAMAGGLSAVADRSRLTLQRLSERNDRRIVELQLPSEGKQPASNGDVFRAFSGVNAALPQHKQYKRIRIEGEVARPGDYVLPPTSTLTDAIQAAGGLTGQAYVFGTEFTREGVRKTQQENYDRALRDMETEFTRNSSTQKALTADEASAQASRAAGTTRLLERLRAVRPTGRVVLQLAAGSKDLPPLTVEDGDRLYIPAIPTTVGVFGSVFNAGSYLISNGNTIDDMLKQAGGPTRGADTSSIFVLRANGSVISARQAGGGWLGMGAGVSGVLAQPGDTVFVPEELNKTTFVQEAKEWTQILYQFGLGAAALKTIKN